MWKPSRWRGPDSAHARGRAAQASAQPSTRMRAWSLGPANASLSFSPRGVHGPGSVRDEEAQSTRGLSRLTAVYRQQHCFFARLDACGTWSRSDSRYQSRLHFGLYSSVLGGFLGVWCAFDGWEASLDSTQTGRHFLMRIGLSQPLFQQRLRPGSWMHLHLYREDPESFACKSFLYLL